MPTGQAMSSVKVSAMGSWDWLHYLRWFCWELLHYLRWVWHEATDKVACEGELRALAWVWARRKHCWIC